MVEDEQDLAELLAYNLSQAGHDVTVAHCGARALSAAAEESFDLVILDLMLPDVSGTDVCRRLREREQTAAVPIIMLTAKGAESDRIAGFEAGADDYVVKPFSPRELSLRVDAILRRASLSSAPSNGDILKIGDLVIDISKHEARYQRSLIDLTPLEFRLLRDLAERAGHVQRRDDLLERVWQYQSGVETRTVDTHIKRLREKLGEAAKYVETIRGIGYRMRDSADE